MMIRKRLIGGACLLVLALAGTVQTAAAADEGMLIGVIEEVDREAGIVVIDGQRYRTYGNQVQPPADTHSESENYETRPFERGLIVRYTVEPGNPPAIRQAWSID